MAADPMFWLQLGAAVFEGGIRVYRLAKAEAAGQPVTAAHLAAARKRTDDAVAGLEAAVARRTGKEPTPNGQ